MKLLILIILISCTSSPNRVSDINGKPIICIYEAYNCPSYRGPHEWKRLRGCEDVKAVWNTCSGDIHGLDGDNDGRPCQQDCSF